MEKISFALKNEKLKQYDLIAIFIVLMNLAGFVYLCIYTSGTATRIPAAVSFILLIFLLTVYYISLKQKRNNTRYIHAGLFVCVLAWISVLNFIAVLASLALLLFYMAAKKPLFANFYTDRIVLTSFPEKTFSWSELNNVILKDDLLTMDCKNNKVIQSEIVSSPHDINEAEFNDFCRVQLNK